MNRKERNIELLQAVQHAMEQVETALRRALHYYGQSDKEDVHLVESLRIFWRQRLELHREVAVRLINLIGWPEDIILNGPDKDDAVRAMVEKLMPETMPEEL